ncbi:MAG: helicase-exonuclease AddAB subunit AddB [Clostridia bacterium]|nr:MAG: helicase-exonuclease AddAB subunit AddB [Clostridia bacterium]
MSLRFIVGRAGSGKTRACLEEITTQLRSGEDGPALILLVPEQATFQTELALLRQPGITGSARAQVLSFRRLAFRVLKEAGGATRPPLGELARAMLIRTLLERHAGELQAFSQLAGRVGLASSLARGIGELKTYCLGPEAVAAAHGALAAQGEGDSPLTRKLHDVALLYRDMEEYLAGRYTDPDDYLTLVGQRLAAAGFLQRASLWVDGFTGFTPQEMAVLTACLRTAGRVTVTLCLDPGCLAGEIGETEVFYPVWDTYRSLRELAAAAGVAVEPPLVFPAPGRTMVREAIGTSGHPGRQGGAGSGCGPEGVWRVSGMENTEAGVGGAGAGLKPEVGVGRGAMAAVLPRYVNPALAHLERELFSRPVKAYAGQAEGLRLLAAANPRAEVEAAAGEMRRLAREEGYRWRDMALILPDLEAYRSLLATVLADAAIPFFIDEKTPVLHHPLVDLLQGCLEIVSGNWAYEPVFRVLKTDLLPVDREEVDLLENYVLAHGIRGAGWLGQEPWSFRRQFTLGEEEEPAGEAAVDCLEQVEAARQKVVISLRGFGEALAGVERASGYFFTQVLYRLLEDLHVADTLQRWQEEAMATGDMLAAREHVPVWNGVMEVMDQLVAGLGAEEYTLKEYAEVLYSGLEDLQFGRIPPGLDQVIVGSPERSRLPEVRAAFILGANEGAFPARPAENALFSDADREALEAQGLVLAPGSRRWLFAQQFSIYQALTRAREYLWVSWPLADSEGRALSPAPVVSQLRRLFPGLAGKGGAGDGGELGEVGLLPGVPRVAGLLAQQLRLARRSRELDPWWRNVYHWLVADAGRRQAAGRVIVGLARVNAEKDLPAEVVAGLYGTRFGSSTSRLELFAACPFAHFAAYGLKLNERPVYKVDAPGLGIFLHAAMKLVVTRLQEAGLDPGEMEAEAAFSLAAGVVDELAPQLQDEILLSSARYEYLALILKGIVGQAMAVLREHARRGKFRPVAVEARFGPGEKLSGLELELDGGRRVVLRGQIDRIDAARGRDGRHYLRVVDYKSRPRDLKVRDVESGLSLQLPLYLALACRRSRGLVGEEAEPAGLLYSAVHNPLLRAEVPPDPQVAEAERLAEVGRMQGLVLADPEIVRLMDEQAAGAPLVPVRLKQDGNLAKSSRALTPEEMQDLLQRAVDRAAALAAEILAGEVAIAPYRRGQETACRYCAYHPVCQFDLLAGNAYRRV